MKLEIMEFIKRKNSMLMVMMLAVSLLSLAAGCSNNNDSGGTQNYLFYNRYGAPEVVNYIEKYGNDYEKTQFVDSGKSYGKMTWHSKGVAVTYLYDTGQVVKEETFNPDSSK
ncbi:MAG: hypothetical protein QMC67_14640 [Candidatus Wallbacteria bacterium]